MKRMIIPLLIFLAFTAVQTSSALELSESMPAENHRISTGMEICPDVPYYPGSQTRTVDEVGYTFYDFQTNGSSGDRIIVHDDGSVHICWTNLASWPYPPAARYIYSNWLAPGGEWGDPSQVNQTNPGGYCQMAEITGNRVAIGYHETPAQNPLQVTLAIEFDPPGLGFYDFFDPPDEIYPQSNASPGILFWPYLTVDRNGYIHIVSTEYTELRMQRMAYTRSEDAGTTWTSLQLVDTVMVISSVMDASPVSDKVVLAYSKCNDTLSQWNNDIVYYLSEDGISWNWRYGRQNVTDYANDDDSLWAYTDCDVLIDYNDVIHLVWNASRINSDNEIAWKTFLFHYRSDTGEITEITHHPDSLFADICGDWNRPICKMSLGCNASNTDFLAVSWTQFDTADVSAGGFGNGDIWCAWSYDGGSNWYDSNFTDTQSPECFPGECMSEHWGCMADEVTPPSPLGIHLTYIIDKDAGGIVNEEGSATLNPVGYQGEATSVAPIVNPIPEDFSLKGNYPNPFNANTTISFELRKRSFVKLNIYDLTGAKVTCLIDGELDAGSHDIVWEADNYASGVYFYNLETEEYSETKQAVLIK